MPVAGHWSSPLQKCSSRRPCLQCLLRLDPLWEMGIDSVWSGETALFLRGKIIAPQHFAPVYGSMLCDVAADDSLAALDMAWPMQTEIRTSTPPMKSWSPERTLSTRCHLAMTTSNQSKAHALPAARRHHHVWITLRNLLAVPSPCHGISEDASCDMKTVRRCGGIGISFCSATSTRKARPAERSASSTRDTWGSTSLWLTLLCGLVWESLCAPNRSTKGQSSRELSRCQASASGFKTTALCR